MQPAATPPRLIRPGVDGLLVGWLAVALGSRFGLPTPPGISAVYWTGVVVVAAHFGLSYHLAYSGGLPSLRARPVALVVGPLLLLAAVGGLVVWTHAAGPAAGRPATRALLTSVYLMTTWHYVKQVYGVGRVGAAFGKVALDGWDVKVLRYGLYPLWFLNAAQYLVRGNAYSFAGVRVGYGLLPHGLLDALRILAIATVVPLVAVLLGIAIRGRRWPPSLLVAPYAAALLWLALPTGPALTVLLLAPFHALQYLAVGHRAEVSVASTRPGDHGAMWWLNVFGGAAAGGLLLSRWLPQLLDGHRGPAGGTLLFTAAIFVFFNLHHYLIDASIWRSKGELVKAVVRGPVAQAAVAAPHPQLVTS